MSDGEEKLSRETFYISYLNWHKEGNYECIHDLLKNATPKTKGAFDICVTDERLREKYFKLFELFGLKGAKVTHS